MFRPGMPGALPQVQLACLLGSDLRSSDAYLFLSQHVLSQLQMQASQQHMGNAPHAYPAPSLPLRLSVKYAYPPQAV